VLAAKPPMTVLCLVVAGIRRETQSPQYAVTAFTWQQHDLCAATQTRQSQNQPLKNQKSLQSRND
jgi:hypothetical protein